MTTTPISISLVSFGFKYGQPSEQFYDLILNIRDAPNPYWDETLRPYSGEDEIIQKFFLNSPEMMAKLDSLQDQIDSFITEKLTKKSSEKPLEIQIGIGCTGGKHRSVFAVMALAKRLSSKYPSVRFEHRDQHQW